MPVIPAIGATATYLLYASLATTAISAGVGAVGAIQQGQAQQQAARYNAQVQQNNALAEEYNRRYQAQLAERQQRIAENNLAVSKVQGEQQISRIDELTRMEEERHRRAASAQRLKGDRDMAEFSTRAGASGITLSGSALDVWQDIGAESDKLALESEDAALRARYSGDLDIWRVRSGIVDETNHTSQAIWGLKNDAGASDWNSLVSIGSSRAGATLSTMSGNNAVTSSYYNATGSILGGIGQATSMYPSFGKK